MKKADDLYSHLLNQFIRYSTEELIELNNELVKSSEGWGKNRATFRTAVLTTLARKGLNLSPIISRDDGFTSIRIVPIKLEADNTIVALG